MLSTFNVNIIRIICHNKDIEPKYGPNLDFL